MALLNRIRKTAASVLGGFRKRNAPDRAAVLLLAFMLAANIAALATLPMDRILRRPRSLVITDMYGAPMRGLLSADGEWSFPVPLSEMGRWMPAVVVELEDRRFYTHRGIDLIALSRAIYQNISSRRVVSGASTITSQVIRIAVERERTPLSKLAEFAQGSALELVLDKDEILEAYLNGVPFGGNTRGVEAAARTWFGKPAKELSLAEAALLAGLLRGPSFYRPDRHPERALKLRDRLIDTLAERGTATAEEARRAKLEPLPQGRLELAPSLIQAADMAAQKGDAQENADGYGRFRSTLDPGKQHLLFSELKRAVSAQEPGVTAAAVLVENESGKVRGYVGNVREGTGAEAAWVDCAASPRSPGSALKPFIYALAFASGRLTPDSMMADAPLPYAGGGTRNFDRAFRGPVTARAALRDSLNVPAVAAMRLVGTERTLSFLRSLGFSSLVRDASWYGDSLALGGCEVSPLELARAYRTLAAGGLDSPLVWCEDAAPREGRRVMSDGAAALVLDVLKGSRRNIPAFTGTEADGKTLAFKTGTSYGLRDAWTAAVTPRWTLVVWLGDPSGRPHGGLVGLTAAAPAAMRIMLRLTRKGEWFQLPSSVYSAEICPLSGAPPNGCCPLRSEGLRIKGVSDNEPCALHAIKDGRLTIRWPEELELFFAGLGSRGDNPAKLTIISPKAGASYQTGGTSGMLLLSSRGGSGPVYWFADGELVGVSEDGSGVVWPMSEGRHKISAADEHGASDERVITVKKSLAGTELPPLLEESP